MFHKSIVKGICWEIGVARTMQIISLLQCVLWFLSQLNIRKTYPCNVYPLEPQFYIAKLGYAGVYLIFLFLLQNIDCEYSLEPVLTCTHNLCFEQKIRKLSKNNLLKIFNFYS